MPMFTLQRSTQIVELGLPVVYHGRKANKIPGIALHVTIQFLINYGLYHLGAGPIKTLEIYYLF